MDLDVTATIRTTLTLVCDDCGAELQQVASTITDGRSVVLVVRVSPCEACADGMRDMMRDAAIERDFVEP